MANAFCLYAKAEKDPLDTYTGPFRRDMVSRDIVLRCVFGDCMLSQKKRVLESNHIALFQFCTFMNLFLRDERMDEHTVTDFCYTARAHLKTMPIEKHMRLELLMVVNIL